MGVCYRNPWLLALLAFMPPIFSYPEVLQFSQSRRTDKTISSNMHATSFPPSPPRKSETDKHILPSDRSPMLSAENSSSPVSSRRQPLLLPLVDSSSVTDNPNPIPLDCSPVAESCTTHETTKNKCLSSALVCGSNSGLKDIEALPSSNMCCCPVQTVNEIINTGGPVMGEEPCSEVKTLIEMETETVGSLLHLFGNQEETLPSSLLHLFRYTEGDSVPARSMVEYKTRELTGWSEKKSISADIGTTKQSDNRFIESTRIPEINLQKGLKSVNPSLSTGYYTSLLLDDTGGCKFVCCPAHSLQCGLSQCCSSDNYLCGRNKAKGGEPCCAPKQALPTETPATADTITPSLGLQHNSTSSDLSIRKETFSDSFYRLGAKELSTAYDDANDDDPANCCAHGIGMICDSRLPCCLQQIKQTGKNYHGNELVDVCDLPENCNAGFSGWTLKSFLLMVMVLVLVVLCMALCRYFCLRSTTGNSLWVRLRNSLLRRDNGDGDRRVEFRGNEQRAGGGGGRGRDEWSAGEYPMAETTRLQTQGGDGDARRK